MNSFFKIIWEVIVIAAIIAYFSLMKPSSDVMHIKLFQIPYFDKIIHFCFYYVFSIVLLRSYFKARKFIRRYYVFSILIAFLYGVLIELIQYFFIPYRSGEIADALVNLAGAFCGIFFVSAKKMMKIRYMV